MIGDDEGRILEKRTPLQKRKHLPFPRHEKGKVSETWGCLSLEAMMGDTSGAYTWKTHCLAALVTIFGIFSAGPVSPLAKGLDEMHIEHVCKFMSPKTAECNDVI